MDKFFKELAEQGDKITRSSEFYPQHLTVPRALVKQETFYSGMAGGIIGRVYARDETNRVYHNFHGPAFVIFDTDMNRVVELWYLFGTPIEKSDILNVLGEEVTFPLTDEQIDKLTLKYK